MAVTYSAFRAKGPTPSAFELHLQAVRKGEWRLHLDEKTLRGTALYHLGWDVGERDNLLNRYPNVVREIEQAARSFNRSLEQEIRPLGPADGRRVQGMDREVIPHAEVSISSFFRALPAAIHRHLSPAAVNLTTPQRGFGARGGVKSLLS